MDKLRYRSEIDGLRAIAVIPVILFHADIEIFSGGFVGVDIFFVISGYLITTIILTEMEKNTFSLVNFYERRARRILPALFFIILISLPFSWFLLTPSEMKDFSDSLLAVVSFSSNILFWSQADYWDTASELKPLLHTWSLAVEEQYYIFFPLFIMFMWKFRKRWLLGSLFVMAGISLAMAHWGAHNKPSATFYLLPTRGWELIIGASTAFYFLYKKEPISILTSNRLLNETLSVTGFIMIIYSIFYFNEKTPFPSLYTLLPTLGTALIILFSSSQTITGRLLANKQLVGIGLISYSAYLWHQPVFAFSRYLLLPEPNGWFFVCLTIAVFPLSYLTWQFVERPFRNKEAFGRKNIFIFAFLGSFLIGGIGAAGHFYDGFKQRERYTELFVKKYQPDNKILQDLSWENLRALSTNNEYGVENNKYDEKLWFKESDKRKKLLLVGNSHSKDIFNLLINSNDAKTNFQVARYGTQIRDLINQKSSFFDSLNYHHADVIMIASRYSDEDLDSLEKVVQLILNDNKKVVIVKNIFEFSDFTDMNLADFIFQTEYLKRYKNGEISDFFVADKVSKAYYFEFLNRARKSIPKRSDNIIKNIIKKHSHVVVLDRMDYACNQEALKCYSMDSQFNKYYYDYGHHTLEGGRFFGEIIDQINWLKNIK